MRDLKGFGDIGLGLWVVYERNGVERLVLAVLLMIFGRRGAETLASRFYVGVFDPFYFEGYTFVD